jgi:hypothetical protein
MDLIILFIYLIGVTYVLARAIGSLDDQTRMDFDKKRSNYDQQVTEKKFGDIPLKDILEVGFSPEPVRYKFSEQPKFVQMTMRNKSDKLYIYVHWDDSSMTNYEARVRRVLRISPGVRLTDLTESQVPGIAPPMHALRDRMTTDESMALNKNNVFEATKPIVDLDELERRSKLRITPQKVKDMHLLFKERKEPLVFTLFLRIEIVDPTANPKNSEFYVLTLSFALYKMPWLDHLPWSPKRM